MARPILTLTTDFGLRGSYVAEMKGTLLGLVPDVVFVDVCHTIAPQSLAEGAFVLERLAGAFPVGTVHLAIVDPGGRTSRGWVAAEAAGRWWLAPDNGLLSRVSRVQAPARVIALENQDTAHPWGASPFQGWEKVARAVAHLLREGVPLDLGSEVDPSRLVTLPDLDPVATPEGYQGRVQFVDSFGNLITNIHVECLNPASRWSTTLGESRLVGLVRGYEEAPPGAIVAMLGYTGYLEIAEVNGNAARTLGLGVGAAVTCLREVTA